MTESIARHLSRPSRAARLRAAFGGSLLLLAGCGDDSSATGGGGSGGAPISDATELDCPNPGLLPFRTETNAFADADNQLVAEGSPRNKDEASDTLGLPGGARANTYFAIDAASSSDDVLLYEGKKARTGQNSGLSSVPLGGEAVSLWYYDPGQSKWLELRRTSTDDVGQYSMGLEALAGAEIGRPLYSILEADGTCSEHYDYLLPQGTKVIVADIDGTLTLSDDELLQQVSDGSYVPKQNEAADELMNRWAEKGYVTIYMSARPHGFRSETRTWLKQEGFPTGPLITANALVVDETARAYKASWLNRILDDFQWDVVAVYGNAQSDIDAYEDAGIPKDVTFIIGPLAGMNGTQPIDDNDYTDHVATYVEQQPDI